MCVYLCVCAHKHVYVAFLGSTCGSLWISWERFVNFCKYVSTVSRNETNATCWRPASPGERLRRRPRDFTGDLHQGVWVLGPSQWSHQGWVSIFVPLSLHCPEPQEGGSPASDVTWARGCHHSRLHRDLGDAQPCSPILGVHNDCSSVIPRFDGFKFDYVTPKFCCFSAIIILRLSGTLSCMESVSTD